MLPPCMSPALHLSADDLASYFLEKTQALRWNPSPFHRNLPSFCVTLASLPPHRPEAISSLFGNLAPSITPLSCITSFSSLWNNCCQRPSVFRYFLSLERPTVPSSHSSVFPIGTRSCPHRNSPAIPQFPLAAHLPLPLQRKAEHLQAANTSAVSSVLDPSRI